MRLIHFGALEDCETDAQVLSLTAVAGSSPHVLLGPIPFWCMSFACGDCILPCICGWLNL